MFARHRHEARLCAMFLETIFNHPTAVFGKDVGMPD